ncbi:unnamed protein product [Pleuronectes platessa]|uniref:Uncharacterized protein n=1 Tax=Pleuronectes platessa TaxID=8262 RepID=A0A9N7VIL6_PLEPL|nr:unnamed protein product [Pleuronectes platessa]
MKRTDTKPNQQRRPSIDRVSASSLPGSPGAPRVNERGGASRSDLNAGSRRSAQTRRAEPGRLLSRRSSLGCIGRGEERRVPVTAGRGVYVSTVHNPARNKIPHPQKRFKQHGSVLPQSVTRMIRDVQLVSVGRCCYAPAAPVVVGVYAGMPKVSSTVRMLGCAGSPVHCLAPKAPTQPYSQPPDVRPRPDQSAARHASNHQAAPS